MTPLELLDALKVFIEEETKDIFLPVRVDKDSGESKERRANVYRMQLPTKDAEIQQIPYILLQFLKQEDLQEAGQPTESSCMIRIVVATYSKNGEEGSLCLLNLLTRIRIAFLRKRIIAERFLLNPPIEMIVYPDNTAPYYLGEMVCSWTMPVIEREV
ncbi:MAG: hypothetical protein VB047_09475 [Anaerotignum propionicum]|uniref:hypothetical protein n=1 Tax=Anaerotignum propionicum TaxID=28446 RepID=UPI002B20EB78|nr:hypothetical protein [Anaerotignum propionicum]MEA5057770.1 hypothetical protein [Anaerotignum propionicum]